MALASAPVVESGDAGSDCCGGGNTASAVASVVACTSVADSRGVEETEGEERGVELWCGTAATVDSLVAENVSGTWESGGTVLGEDV